VPPFKICHSRHEPIVPSYKYATGCMIYIVYVYIQFNIFIILSFINHWQRCHVSLFSSFSHIFIKIPSVNIVDKIFFTQVVYLYFICSFYKTIFYTSFIWIVKVNKIIKESTNFKIKIQIQSTFI